MSTFDLLYRSMMYGSSQSILSSKGTLLPKAFLRIIRSLSRALRSTYLMWFCFLNLGLITAKKLLAALSLAALNTSNSFFDFSCLFSKSLTTFLSSCISALTSGCLSRLLQKLKFLSMDHCCICSCCVLQCDKEYTAFAARCFHFHNFRTLGFSSSVNLTRFVSVRPKAPHLA